MVWSLHSAKVKAELSAQQDVNSSVWSQEEARSRLASEQDFNRGHLTAEPRKFSHGWSFVSHRLISSGNLIRPQRVSGGSKYLIFRCKVVTV